MTGVAGEIKPLRINTRYDLTGVISFILEITDPLGVATSTTDDLSLGLVDVTLNDGTVLKANEYVIYAPGTVIFPLSGSHLVKITANFGATKLLKSFEHTLEIAA